MVKDSIVLASSIALKSSQFISIVTLPQSIPVLEESFTCQSHLWHTRLIAVVSHKSHQDASAVQNLAGNEG
jgi:hypothetical protein